MIDKEKAGIKNRTKIREENKKNDMREKLSFTQTIIQIDNLEDEILNLARSEGEITNGAVSAFTAVLNSKWKKINKLLPDIKAIEHVVEHKPNVEECSEEELEAIIASES